MSTENIILEHLRAIRATLEQHGDDLREIKGRLGILEQQDAGHTNQYAHLSVRLDRVDQRLSRIEKRLDLVEA